MVAPLSLATFRGYHLVVSIKSRQPLSMQPRRVRSPDQLLLLLLHATVETLIVVAAAAAAARPTAHDDVGGGDGFSDGRVPFDGG